MFKSMSLWRCYTPLTEFDCVVGLDVWLNRPTFRPSITQWYGPVLSQNAMNDLSSSGVDLLTIFLSMKILSKKWFRKLSNSSLVMSIWRRRFWHDWHNPLREILRWINSRKTINSLPTYCLLKAVVEQLWLNLWKLRWISNTTFDERTIPLAPMNVSILSICSINVSGLRSQKSMYDVNTSLWISSQSLTMVSSKFHARFSSCSFRARWKTALYEHDDGLAVDLMASRISIDLRQSAVSTRP